MKFKIALYVLLLPITTYAQNLRVAVAANAQYVSEALVKEFKKQTGVEVQLIVGASGKFTAQIQEGAPFDVFMSADMVYPQRLYEKKLTVSAPKVYACGTLVLWSTKLKQPLISSLTQQSISKIAVANPKLAPYGTATMQALKQLNLLNALQPKIVYGESIAQVNQYLLTGVADAAFTAKAVVMHGENKNKGSWTDVDSKLYKPIAQGVVILKNADKQNMKYATMFYNFLFGSTAKHIFKAYGYK
ncbi:molybdate ABC transporter substrate-binding protein [Mucilaginibacter aquatilis]|uniref:Molybdate ABC transporter substrate-binding protein n=1 Tax=Mucilaginibacter aquatilis TaxID=1517760 RepID=A0A6I4IFI3_9SPHI|nr:molybdate ABC transporter substrate-binding protein [Mucilaginibacter aquatilis]MVN92306.1 molybdate ABC transporter substrate-binding protein [Mucilaginibacter aquatilis]